MRIDQLNELCRNMIHLTVKEKEPYRLGGTCFGGVPDVPEDFVWPTFATATYEDDEVKNRPLSFLAQFNCSELAEFDKEGLLPNVGLLSFFYEVDSQRWGYDPEDAGCARVFWFPDIAGLKAAEEPENLPEYGSFPSLKIKMTAEKSLPVWEDLSLLPEFKEYGKDWNKWSCERAAFGVAEYDECSKLLGWPDVIQNNMTEECELVSRGYYLGNGWDHVPKPDLAEVERTSLDGWRLLLQLDIVSDDDFELMFGDGGRLYFYIRKEDLQERKFDKIWLISQCC